MHHTNEIAQSEAATGAKWVNYWVHAEWLLIGKEKMAKSSGNFMTLAGLIEKGYDPLDYRYFCLGAHYRTQLSFTLGGTGRGPHGPPGLRGKDRAAEGGGAGGAAEPHRQGRASTLRISRRTPPMT